MSKKEVYRIDIPIEAEDKYSDGLNKAKKDVENLEKSVKKSTDASKKHMTGFERATNRTTNRIRQRLDRITQSRWSMTLRAIDRATPIIRSVSSFAQRMTGRTYRFTVRALDYATRPLRNIVSSMSSILGTIGVVGGVAGGVVVPIKMTIERQNITTAFEVLLGSAEKADQRIRELTEFAGQTPYARDEIYEASRVLEVFTKGVLSTGDGLRLVGDIAAGTQQDFNDVALWMGRLYDAMAAGRPVGEMTSRLQEMGAIGGEARARIEELAESGGDIKKIWPEATKEFERYNGMMEKLSDNLANLLLGVKTSFMNNVLMRWGQGIEKGLSPALQKFREWRKDNEEQITAMGDAIERYGERITQGFMRRIERGASYIGDLFFGEEYKDLSFGAKVNIMIDDANNAFSEWWERTGRNQVTGLSGKMGSALGGTLKGAILGVLGVESEGGNVYVSAGFEAGSSFVTGFIDGFDAGRVASAIGRKLLDMNIEGVSSAAKGEGFGGLIGAGFVDLLLLGAGAKLLSGPRRALKGLGKGAKRVGRWGTGAGGWLLDKTIRRSKPQAPQEKWTAREQRQRVRATPIEKPSRPPRSVIVDQSGRPISSKTTPPQPKSRNIFRTAWEGSKGVGKRALDGAKSVGRGASRLLGPLGFIGAVDIADSATMSVSDWLFGHKAGQEKMPGIFDFRRNFGFKEREVYETDRQGALSKAWQWLRGGDSKGTGTTSAIESGLSSQPINSDASFHQSSVITQNLQALATWIAQASNWVVGAFQPLQGSGEMINHNVSALNTWLGQSSSWVVGAFQPLEVNGQLVQHNLSALATWTAQASGWVVAGLHPIQERGPLVSHNLSALATWIGRASGWIASLSGIQSGANSVKSALSGLAARIRNTSAPNVSNVPKYAKGTSSHPGGPAIVGDGGGSELVRLPNGRTWLSPSTDTLVNLPKGTQVLPHNKTKKLVDVPQYADGIGSFSRDGIIGGSTFDVSFGDVNVEVVIQGAEIDDTESFAESIADPVANAIAEKMKQVNANMPD